MQQADLKSALNSKDFFMKLSFHKILYIKVQIQLYVTIILKYVIVGLTYVCTLIG